MPPFNLLLLALLSLIHSTRCQRFGVPPNGRSRFRGGPLQFRPNLPPRHNDRFRRPDRFPPRPPPPFEPPDRFPSMGPPTAGSSTISEHFAQPPTRGPFGRFPPPRGPIPPRQGFPNPSFRDPANQFPPPRAPPSPGRHFGNNLRFDPTRDTRTFRAPPGKPPNNRYVNGNKDYRPPIFYDSKPASSAPEYTTKTPHNSSTTVKADAYEKMPEKTYYDKPDNNVDVYRDSAEKQMNDMLASMEVDGTLREAGWQSTKVRPLIGQAFPIYKSVRDMLLARERTRLEMINLKKKYHAKRAKLKNHYRLKPYKI